MQRECAFVVNNRPASYFQGRRHRSDQRVTGSYASLLKLTSCSRRIVIGSPARLCHVCSLEQRGNTDHAIVEQPFVTRTGAVVKIIGIVKIHVHIEAALWAIAQRSSEWKQARAGNMDIEERHEIAEAASSLRYWKKFISTYSV